MKKIYIFTFALLSAVWLNAQDAGIFQDDIILDFGEGAGNEYFAGGLNPDGNQSLNGINFGTVTQMTLKGGQIKSFKNNGGDVTGAELNYCIYEDGTSCTSGFTQIVLPFGENLPNTGDQLWEELSLSTDLLNGLNPGTTYSIAVYWKIDTNLNNGNGGQVFDSNSGGNYIGTFTVGALGVSSVNNKVSALQAINNKIYFNESGVYDIRVFNTAGQMVMEKKNHRAGIGSLVDMSVTDPGVYFIQISSDKGVQNLKTVVR